MHRVGENPTEEELKAMVDQVDKVDQTQLFSVSNDILQDKNGIIDLEEFLSMMAERERMNSKIEMVFKVFDHDGDG